MIEFLLLFPLFAGVLLVLAKSKALNSAALVLYSAAHLGVFIYLRERPYEVAPYFAVDSVNILFLLVLGAVNLGVSLYMVNFLNRSRISKKWHTYYTVSFLVFVFAMTGVLLSTHLALLWVFVEMTTLASAPFIYFDRTKSSLEAIWKYIFICSIGIALSFVGIILLSMGTGSMNSLFFRDLYADAAKIDPFWLKLSFLFMLVGFGTKAGLAPVHAWLPDAHSESPSPVSAMLSGTLLNAAFFGIVRVFRLMELAHRSYHPKILLLVMGFLSLFVSAVFILKSTNYKRMLAYSSIENMGIAAIGLGIGGIGVFAGLLHIVSHSLAKAAFFLTSGNIYHSYGTKEISGVSGLLRKDRVSGWLWILCFLAIAGFPPFPSFISEFLIAKALLEKGSIVPAVLFFVLLTVILYGMGKSVLKMSFGSSDSEGEPKRISFFNYAPQVCFITLLIFFGLFMPPFLLKIINSAVRGYF